MEKGHTYSQAAIALGTTRLAIAGVANRARIVRAAAVNPPRLPRRKHQGLERFTPLLGNIVQAMPEKFGAWEALPGSSPTDLDHRTGCCWPIGPGKPFLYCNEPADDTERYCSIHTRMSRNASMYRDKGKA